MDLRDLRSGFRDDDQCRRAGMVVHLRLADDRNHDECRYLLKFQWQLGVSYREVTVDELREHVGAEKLAAVEGLIAALEQSPDDVERWIEETVASFPLIEDRGYLQWERRHRGRRMWARWLSRVSASARALTSWTWKPSGTSRDPGDRRP